MRSSSVLPVLSSLALLLNYSAHSAATPLVFDDNALDNRLEKRCENPCGYNDWLCCETGQTCSTNNNQEAVCVDGNDGGGGEYQYYTTTYVLTNTDLQTITSVWSSQIAAATSTGTCRLDLGEIKCGKTCCEAAQECVEGQCVAESSSVAVTATGTDSGTEATPGVRGTSNGASTVTETSAPTITEGFTAPVGTDGADLIGAEASSEDGGLSGGAIAGIVIGSIAGAFLLFLLCACICFKNVLQGLLAALGIGKKRRKTDTYIEGHHSHHAHGSRPPVAAPGRRTWFGTKPAEDSEVGEKKSKWGWGTVAIILGALALCLGLKRKRERDHDDDKTESSYPSSYYYYSDYYSGTGSSRSSDRRTRDTRRSRRSRTRSGR